MATVNLRNDTSLFIKVNGIEDVIVPNTELEDKTIQWESTENKTIQFFPTEECNGTPLCEGSILFTQNDGIYVNRGNFTDAQLVKMQADITATALMIEQIDNDGGGKLIDWSEITPETVVNLSFWNL